MAHSIISDEIHAGILTYSSWASSNVIKCHQMYSISSIEEHVIGVNMKYFLLRGYPTTSISGNNVRTCLLERYFLSS